MEPFLLIALIVVAFAAAIWFLRRRNAPRPAATPARRPRSLENLRETIDGTPDKPINIGYKISWLAIRSSNTQDVIQSLALDNLQAANWRTGYLAVANGHTFVSPPVDGWILAISQELPELGHGPDAEEWTVLLESLSEKFGEVQYFGTHRVVGYHAWARFKNGVEERAFAYLGESAETLVERGSRTQAEAELGYHYFDSQSPDAESESYWERDDLCFPDEEHVMEVAAKWSVDPNTLESMDLPIGVGWVGSLRRASK